MTRTVLCTVAVIFLAESADVRAQVVSPPVRSPVDHPLLGNHAVRTPSIWRSGVEKYGESLARGSLGRRGYRVEDVKLPGNRGIDLIAIKRNAGGDIKDVRLIEVKTHYGERLPKLGITKDGPQTSLKWFARRLRALRSRGQRGKQLHLEISRFRNQQRVPLEKLGEVHDINLRTGRYTIREPVTLAERAGPMSIGRHLNRIRARSTDPAVQAWAVRHVAQLDQLSAVRMGHWWQVNPESRALHQVTSSKLLLLEEKQALRGARRGLVKAAGRMAVVVAVAVDAYEVYEHVRGYRQGQLSQREFVIALSRSSGGIAGAWAGAAGGAWVGAELGALGGPWAWITVPTGVAIGGAIGGVGGYFGGSYVGGETAELFYAALDADVRERVSEWLKSTAAPFAE